MNKQIKEQINKIDLNLLKNGFDEKIVWLNNQTNEINEKALINQLVLNKICNIQKSLGNNTYTQNQKKKEPFWNNISSKSQEFNVHLAFDNIKLIKGDSLGNNSGLLTEQIKNIVKFINLAENKETLLNYSNLLNESLNDEKLEKYISEQLKYLDISKVISFSQYKNKENFINDIKNIDKIILKALNDGDDKSFEKLDNVLHQMIFDTNGYYSGTKQEFRLKEVISQISNVIENNKLNYKELDKLQLNKIKKEFFNELLEQVGESKLKNLKFLSNGDELKEIRDKYVTELVEKVLLCSKTKDLNIKQELEVDIKQEIENLNFKFLGAFTSKLIASNIKITKDIENIIGTPIVEGINNIKNIANKAKYDLSGIDISEQATILNRAKTPGAVSQEDASFAASVLHTQQMALKQMKKNNDQIEID